MELGLKDKVVLVTGANNPLGIGAATALEFAKEGAKIAIAYKILAAPRSDSDEGTDAFGLPFYHKMRAGNAAGVERKLKAAGAQCITLETDLTISSNVTSLFDEIESKLGMVDILVNNAAHYEEADTIFSITDTAIDATYGVNVKASLLLISEFVRRYVARNGAYGRIINLSTDAAQTFAGQIAYGSSKAAIEAFTRSIAIEIGRLGITINTVAPGPVQSGWISPEREGREAAQIPLGRIGKPLDIANAIVFLASKPAEWITGQVIKVSGGHAL